MGGLSWPWRFSCERHAFSCWEGKLSRKAQLELSGTHPEHPSPFQLRLSHTYPILVEWLLLLLSGEPVCWSHLTGKGGPRGRSGAHPRAVSKEGTEPGPPASPHHHAALLQASRPSLQSWPRLLTLSPCWTQLFRTQAEAPSQGPATVFSPKSVGTLPLSGTASTKTFLPSTHPSWHTPPWP